MTSRRSETLAIVDRFYPDHDASISRSLEIEMFGNSECDLRCGKDGEILLRNFSVKEAQDHFRMENKRVVIKCPSCDSYNLLAAAVEKLADGSVVTLPRREA